ncbi:HAD family hydrolase [Phaeodactylibacter xiamenensis]|uniref:HAD family hydrolase n=1 Tax=Phaeodactylibacter xiamenensis TaxID=1524460 RepID=UPI003BADACD2
MYNNIQVIFWDFDGVILNSNSVRDYGFREVLKKFPEKQVQQLITYHILNGGLSRYVKFRYFFEVIRKEAITKRQVQDLSAHFSDIMLKRLIDPSLLIKETNNFIRQNNNNYAMHIVSGSDQKELRTICKELNIDQYFKSIHGSPKPKIEWIKELLNIHQYSVDHCVLIGDSTNDKEAAIGNNIKFQGYNNPILEKGSETYFIFDPLSL